VGQPKRSSVPELSKLELPKQVLLFARYHSNHWIRNVAQRLLGHIFAYHREQQEQGQKRADLFEILGLAVPEQIVTFTHDLVDCLRKPMTIQEQKDQFVKNLIYLLNEQIKSTDENIMAAFKIDKLFSKISFISRKLMLDIRTAPDRLETILCFFQVSLELMHALD